MYVEPEGRFSHELLRYQQGLTDVTLLGNVKVCASATSVTGVKRAWSSSRISGRYSLSRHNSDRCAGSQVIGGKGKPSSC